MNEIELIRTQLSAERQHATAAARACASAPATTPDAPIEPFRAVAVEYLTWVLSRCEEREQFFQDLLRKRFAAENPHRRAVEAALGLPGSNREALEKLERAPASGSGGAEFLHFFNGPWSLRRDELDRLLEAHTKVTDWRTVSGIDADSMVDERNRWARVKATMPTDTERSSNTVRV
jgi:hypothetical protein